MRPVFGTLKRTEFQNVLSKSLTEVTLAQKWRLLYLSQKLNEFKHKVIENSTSRIKNKEEY